jgi:hypothetical protein
LPGTYAPTIESIVCYPCPPGTACEQTGLSVASLCPQGTFIATLTEDGSTALIISCLSCPQGTWSKNFGLRERGECIKCAPGTVCPVQGSKKPCGHSDLPSPFEAVVNYNDNPVLEYLYPDYNRPPPFTQQECLRLNSGYTNGRYDPYYQKYFYGELIPPYIDVLGRGPYLRPTDKYNLKYQNVEGIAKCYVNYQRYGTPVYRRLAEYHGPQYDIQFGYSHQGYGLFFANGTGYYDGFFGQGSLYIDLPKARRFEPSFNCTKGFRLMNETRVQKNAAGVVTTVYTNKFHDPTGVSRAISLGEDQLYAGTCEADVICYEATYISDLSDAQPCAEGYVCDEGTSSTTSLNSKCRAGYACDYGTTPD